MHSSSTSPTFTTTLTKTTMGKMTAILLSVQIITVYCDKIAWLVMINLWLCAILRSHKMWVLVLHMLCEFNFDCVVEDMLKVPMDLGMFICTYIQVSTSLKGMRMKRKLLWRLSIAPVTQRTDSGWWIIRTTRCLMQMDLLHSKYHLNA